MTMTETTATHEDATTQTTEDALTALQAERERLARKRALLNQQYRDAARRLDVSAMIALRGQSAELAVLIEETGTACALAATHLHAEQAQARVDAAVETVQTAREAVAQLQAEASAAYTRAQKTPGTPAEVQERVRTWHEAQRASAQAPALAQQAARDLEGATATRDEAGRAYEAQLARAVERLHVG